MGSHTPVGVSPFASFTQPWLGFVGHNRVVFNIKGNNFRLVVAVAYVMGAMYVKFVGTHEEYDNINVATVEPER